MKGLFVKQRDIVFTLKFVFTHSCSRGEHAMTYNFCQLHTLLTFHITRHLQNITQVISKYQK